LRDRFSLSARAWKVKMITTTPHYTPVSRLDQPRMKDNKPYPAWKLLLAVPGLLLLSLAGCLGLLVVLVCLPWLLLKDLRDNRQLPQRQSHPLRRRFP
jgi:hypothetical protein